MRYLSMFSGIRGFELGIEKAYSKSKSKNSTNGEGATPQHGGRPLCVGFSELNKYAMIDRDILYKSLDDPVLSPLREDPKFGLRESGDGGAG